MLRLLRLISWPQLRESWGRTLLVVGGIAIGVALIVAINVVNTTVLGNFRRMIDLIAGPAALEVTLGVGEIGFAESTVDLVRDDPDVVEAVPLVRGTIALADAPSEALQLFGADLVTEDKLQRYQISTADRKEVLRGLADPQSVLLTATLARKQSLHVGDSVRLSTPRGVAPFTVRGLLETQGLAAVLGGQIAVMDLPAAQTLLGKDGRIDQIDLMLRDGANTRAVQRRLEARLPPTLTVTRPEQRGQQYDKIVSAFQAMLAGLSALCLVAGVFIIYNTTSTAAVRRATVMAGLRLMGAEASRLFRLLMLESFILGAVGAVVGVGYGLLLAYLLTGMVSESMGVIFQLRFPIQSLVVDARQQLAIVIIGIGAALFASSFAARRASTMEPLEVIQLGATRVMAQRPTGRLLVWWGVMVAVSGISLIAQAQLDSSMLGNLGSTLWNGSVIVVAIPLVSASAALLSWVLPRFFGVEGRLALDSLLRSRTRTGVTVAAVALVLTIGITIATLTASFRRSVESYFEAGGFLAGDLVVSAVATEGGWLETPLPEGLASELKRVDGVGAVESWRAVFGQIYRGERIALFAFSDGLLDPSRYRQRWYREGDAPSAALALQGGTGVNIATTLADRHGLHVGDRIALDTPTGSLELPIVGIVYDYGSDRGSVILNRRLLVEHWRDAMVNRIYVSVLPGVSLDEIRSRIAAYVGDRYRLKMLTLSELVSYQLKAIGKAFAFTDAIQLLVAIVTVAGILDLLLAAIVERRRELALWRVIGADERSVRRAVVVESATIGGLGALLGVGVGLVTAWIWVGINFRYLLGFELEYKFALSATAWYVTLVMLMTVVAGRIAARHAVRQSILEGIQLE